MLEEEGKCEAFLRMPSDDLPESESERALPCKEEEGKCEAFFNMPSDDLPESESERALPSCTLFQTIKSLSSVCYRASEAKDEQLQRLLRELPGAGVAFVDLDAYDDFRELPIQPEETLLLAGTRETLALAAGTPMATIGYGALVGCEQEKPGYHAADEEPVSASEKPGYNAAGEGSDHASGKPECTVVDEGTVRTPGKPECAVTEENVCGNMKGQGKMAGSVPGKVPGVEMKYMRDKELEVKSNAAFPQADLLVEGFEEVDVQLLDRIMKRAQGLPWITVVTKRCVLREITLGDIDDLFALYAQPGITDYTEPLYEREEEEQYTRDYIKHMYRFYGYGMWLVFSKESGELVGRAGFSHQDLGDEIVLEMGYIVGVPWQRQGYATEICEKLIEFARTNLSDFGTLNCFVEPGNVASHGLMKKLDFARSGIVEIKGKEMVRYEMGL